MTCKSCGDKQDVPQNEGPYVVRNCESCGREIKDRPVGKHGIGLEVRKGDQLIIPANWLKLSANPLKSTGHLTRYGLDWFAQLVFNNNIEQKRLSMTDVIDELDEGFSNILRASPIISGLNIDDESQSQAVFSILEANKTLPEWWVYVAGYFLSIAKDAIAKSDAPLAAWAMACAERYRSLHVFKEHFEDVVWMGHSAKKLTDILSIWSHNRENSNEEFWQIQFQTHSIALSQLFSVPVTLIEGKAYVGGQGIDRADGRFVDFIFSGGTASDTMLVEIKTPVTQLMNKSKYRNVHAPSSQLSGSVVQVVDYRTSLTRELGTLTHGKYSLSTFHPRCVVIVGNSAELDNDSKRHSFELFRANLSNVEIVTFDEVFRKIEHLASLFNLVRSVN